MCKGLNSYVKFGDEKLMSLEFRTSNPWGMAEISVLIKKNDFLVDLNMNQFHQFFAHRTLVFSRLQSQMKRKRIRESYHFRDISFLKDKNVLQE